ncbi:hypothetical protein [Microvirga terrestris]|uniref:Uncharacterized protein n=1 Tax=Microvirga terrestris TaxID=2791024 RepID=A0ABS0HV51_9HYPH|nr:hypothetical protein [Microvirga terrestris]MBF9197370.1 hypothetical protein [Microvirga terrestris]
MATEVKHLRFQKQSRLNRVYSPDILPRLQSLLADLADIDFACQHKLAAIERGLGDESIKRRKIALLWQEHQESRAPYVAALEELQEQAKDCFQQ